VSGQSPICPRTLQQPLRHIREMAQPCGFLAFLNLGTPFAISILKAQTHSRRTIMKFENLLLRSLFTACSLACLLTLASMLV
jgi:hypothetical protein